MLHWRVRCVLRRGPIEATSGPDALALVTALTTSLERGYPPPGLGRAARAWGASVGDADAAQVALVCLAEIAIELAADVFQEFPPVGLDPVLEQLAAEAAATTGRGGRHATSEPRGYPDRSLLERHLDRIVADAVTTGGDVALGLVELERSGGAAVQLPRRSLVPVDGEAMADLVDALSRVAGERRVYRLGTRKLAVLMPRTDIAGLGELVLRTTLSAAPRFTWGAASLAAAGPQAIAHPDALMALAEADLHLRRRDLLHARRRLAQRRRRSALATAGSALVLVLGILVGLNGAGGRAGPSRLATASPRSTAPPAPVPPSPASSTQAPGVAGSAPGSPVRLPSPAKETGTSLRLTTGRPAGGGSAPPANPGSATNPPPGGGSPSSPVTAVLDQFLSTVKGMVGELTGVHLDSAGAHLAVGPSSVLPAG